VRLILGASVSPNASSATEQPRYRRWLLASKIPLGAAKKESEHMDREHPVPFQLGPIAM